MNIRIFAEAFSQDPKSPNTDLFFFWTLLQILMMLDEEENVNSRKEQIWMKHGLVDVFESYSTGYRGMKREYHLLVEEKNGRIRVYCQDHKDRLLKKLNDVTSLYSDV